MSISILTPARTAVLKRFVESGGLRELVSFLAVGGGGAVAFILINASLVRLGVAPNVTIIVTTGMLIPPVYLLQHKLTFRSGRNHLSAFPRYAGAQLFGNAIAVVLASLFPEPIKQFPFSASFLIAAIVAALNYGILKFWAFQHTPAQAGSSAS